MPAFLEEKILLRNQNDQGERRYVRENLVEDVSLFELLKKLI